MTSPAELLIAARRRSGLSTRALAARANVALSTITRIENDRVDPTVGMLERLIEATGMTLHANASPSPTLSQLTQAWNADDGVREPFDGVDFVQIQFFVDRLSGRNHAVEAAIARVPKPTGSHFMDNLLAGIAEQLADHAGVPRPDWCANVERLTGPHVTPGPPRVRNRARRTAPPRLASRNVWIERDSIWRDREPRDA